MNARPYTAGDWVKLVLFLTGSLAVIFLFALQPRSSDSQSAPTATPTPSPIRTTSFYDANRVPAVGQQGRIRIDVAKIYGTASEADYGVMMKAVDARDAIGFRDLLLQGRVYEFANGTKLLVIDRRNALSQVRILDGPNVARAVWVLTRFLDY